jgi:hypothetical protein
VIENLEHGVKFLLEKGANPHFADIRGFDACDYAMDTPYADLFPALRGRRDREKIPIRKVLKKNSASSYKKSSSEAQHEDTYPII